MHPRKHATRASMCVECFLQWQENVINTEVLERAKIPSSHMPVCPYAKEHLRWLGHRIQNGQLLKEILCASYMVSLLHGRDIKG